MENKTKVSVVIDGKVYMLAGNSSETYMQRIASYVDGKIRELKQQAGYAKLPLEYKSILLALNIAEELFKGRRMRWRSLIRSIRRVRRSFISSSRRWSIKRCALTRPISW